MHVFTFCGLYIGSAGIDKIDFLEQSTVYLNEMLFCQKLYAVHPLHIEYTSGVVHWQNDASFDYHKSTTLCCMHHPSLTPGEL